VISSNTGNTSGTNEASQTTNTFYSANIKYKYQVGRRTFINDMIHAGGSYSSSIPSKANELVARYYKGAKTDVYYNPEDPSKSCLEKTEETSLFYMGMGAFLIVFGLMIN
jgi:hypothetical protein